MCCLSLLQKRTIPYHCGQAAKLTEVEEADHPVGGLGTNKTKHLAGLAEVQEDAVDFDDKRHGSVADVVAGEERYAEAKENLKQKSIVIEHIEENYHSFFSTFFQKCKHLSNIFALKGSLTCLLKELEV